MYIKEVLDYDDFSGEADIIITDGVYEIMCYCYPRNSRPQLNQRVESVGTFMAEDIMTAPDEKLGAKKTDDSRYSYYLVGKLISREKSLISIGKLIIELDGYLPGDIRVGDVVKLHAVRVETFV